MDEEIDFSDYKDRQVVTPESYLVVLKALKEDPFDKTKTEDLLCAVSKRHMKERHPDLHPTMPPDDKTFLMGSNLLISLPGPDPDWWILESLYSGVESLSEATNTYVYTFPGKATFSAPLSVRILSHENGMFSISWKQAIRKEHRSGTTT